MKDNTITRDEFIEKVKVKIDEWNSEIDALEKRAELEGTKAKVALEKRVVSLREKQHRLREKLSEAQDAGADVWESVKIGMQLIWDDVAETIDETKKSFVEGLHGDNPK